MSFYCCRVSHASWIIPLITTHSIIPLCKNDFLFHWGFCSIAGYFPECPSFLLCGINSTFLGEYPNNTCIYICLASSNFLKNFHWWIFMLRTEIFSVIFWRNTSNKESIFTNWYPKNIVCPPYNFCIFPIDKSVIRTVMYCWNIEHSNNGWAFFIVSFFPLDFDMFIISLPARPSAEEINST